MDTIFRIHMPYCLDLQPDGSYVALNRNYKPLGFGTKDWVRYEEFPVLHNLKGLGPAIATKISCHASPDLTRIYLYDDGCNPANGNASDWNDYMRRLEYLSRLSIRDTIDVV